MKKLSNVFLVVFLLSIVLDSCKKEGIIQIEVIPETTTAVAGKTLVFWATLTPDSEKKGKLGHVTVTIAGTTFFENDFSVKDNQSFVFEYTVSENTNIGDEIEITIIATWIVSPNAQWIVDLYN